MSESLDPVALLDLVNRLKYRIKELEDSRSSARKEIIETIQSVPCGQSMYADSREFKIALDMKKEILRAVEDKEGKGE